MIYRIPWWLRDSLRRVENALIRKVLGQSGMPGGLVWFEGRFKAWALERITNEEFLINVDDYIHQLQEAGEALTRDNLLYHAIAEGTWLPAGDVEWREEVPVTRPASDPEAEAEAFTRHE
jgi:hypothetical protein